MTLNHRNLKEEIDIRKTPLHTMNSVIYIYYQPLSHNLFSNHNLTLPVYSLFSIS